jgi:predicted outer membrane lipoprotein
MITASYIALALFLGYAVAVGLSMAATFGITAASRSFVSKNYRIRTRYKYAQDVAWVVCTAAGGYASALVYGGSHPWLVGVLLVGVLNAVLWLNAWEMRQRGLGHQISMSVGSAAGVAVGFLIHLR